jgi:hypothetical protein
MVPNASTSSVHPRLCALCSYSCACVSLLVLLLKYSHLWLAATPLSLPGAGTVYSDILGLIVLHVNMTSKRTVESETLRISHACCQLITEKKRKVSAGSDDTASMIKGGGYLGARTRQPPTAQTI